MWGFVSEYAYWLILQYNHSVLKLFMGLTTAALTDS